MKYFPLIWSGIWLKPMRTTLILLQVAVAFALFGSLQGMKTGIDQTAAKLAPDVLEVRQSLDSAAHLPVAYADQLTSIPGVKTVRYVASFVGTYQIPTQTVGVEALSKSGAWQMPIHDVLTIAPKDLRALQNTRIGALMTPYLAQKYGWRVGDRISLTSTTLQNNGSGTWVFDIVGMATGARDVSPIIFVNYDYVDEARALDKGTVAFFFVTVSDPRKATAVSERIDRTFANSPSQTTTQPLNVIAQQQVRQLGNLTFVIHSIVSAVLVALIFSIATMMMQTVRERTPELAVLKTLGFGDLAVFLLVVVDALIVCVAGGLIGLGLATTAFPFAAKFLRAPSMPMPVGVLEVGLIAAVLMSLISVSLPASRAAKLQVVAALARR
jgi:putative ABC transport system permease protein